MWNLAGLLLFSLLFPALWGCLVHWLATRFIAPDRSRDAPWPAAADTSGAGEILDYQI